MSHLNYCLLSGWNVAERAGAEGVRCDIVQPTFRIQQEWPLSSNHRELGCIRRTQNKTDDAGQHQAFSCSKNGTNEQCCNAPRY